MSTLKLFVAALVPAALIATSAGVAEARKTHGKIFHRLVEKKALEQADLDVLKPLGQEVRACRQQVKSGALQKGACAPKRMELMKAKIALLEKALPKVTGRRLQRKARRKLRRLQRKLARMQRRMAHPPGAK